MFVADDGGVVNKCKAIFELLIDAYMQTGIIVLTMIPV